MKNHRRQISLSKPLCEREDWKDMKALACILTRLSPPSIFPICPLLSSLFSHSSVCPTSFNLRYFVTVSAEVRAALRRAESSPKSYEYPFLCSLKGSRRSTFSTSSVEKAVSRRPSCTTSDRSSRRADWQACFLPFSCWHIFIIHQRWLVIGFKMIFIVRFRNKSVLFGFCNQPF